MDNPDLDAQGKNIWSRILLDQFVAAVASLGNRIDQLKTETWRLNDKTRLNSLWGEVIDHLKLDHSQSTRHSLYKIWLNDKHEVKRLVDAKLEKINRNANNDSDIYVSNKTNTDLLPELSLPLAQPPLTRSRERNENDNVNDDGNSFVEQISIVFSTTEWKDAFSRTKQKMKDDWTTKVNKKLTVKGTGITCTLKFTTPYFKKGERKKKCCDFSCNITCTIKGCNRKYIMKCPSLPDENSSVLFLVQIFGKEDHSNGPGCRKLTGKERMLVGKVH
ncbi:unnamed protein product [Adineta ricciae]|uniref:Uncharacterized protein n=1 Tax=Adineta ricciae TaxID=249248 RepID=A0A815WN78_ADIRI|nr:unnamed protein product [Adineta ricciae]